MGLGLNVYVSDLCASTDDCKPAETGAAVFMFSKQSCGPCDTRSDRKAAVMLKERGKRAAFKEWQRAVLEQLWLDVAPVGAVPDPMPQSRKCSSIASRRPTHGRGHLSRVPAVCCSCVSQLVGVNTRYTGLGRCARAVGALHSSHARCTPEASQIARWRSSTSGGPAAPTAKIGSRPCSIAFGLISAGCARLVQSVHKFVARIRTPDPPRQWPVHKPRLRTALYSGNQSN